MGPLGWQEMAFIFVLALLLFGPKKLPELGKSVAKALAEFRRAQNELKSTFEREMRSLERENESLKEVTNSYQSDSYNYNHSSYDSGSYNSGDYDSTAYSAVTTASASAPEGAELTPAASPEGTVANGTIAAPEGESANGKSAETAAQPQNGAQASSPNASPADEHQVLT